MIQMPTECINSKPRSIWLRKSRFFQFPHCAMSCLHHVHSSVQGTIMCKSHSTPQAHITCNMCVMWYKETAQLFNLTELKSHLFSGLFHWLKPLTNKVQCAQDKRMSLLMLLGLFWVSQLCCNTAVTERRFWIWWRGRLMCVVVFWLLFWFFCMVNETCNRSLHMTCCIWQNVTEHPSSLAHTLSPFYHQHCHSPMLSTSIQAQIHSKWNSSSLHTSYTHIINHRFKYELSDQSKKNDVFRLPHTACQQACIQMTLQFHNHFSNLFSGLSGSCWTGWFSPHGCSESVELLSAHAQKWYMDNVKRCLMKNINKTITKLHKKHDCVSVYVIYW